MRKIGTILATVIFLGMVGGTLVTYAGGHADSGNVIRLPNPLGEGTTFASLFNEILRFLRNIGGVIASIMMIIGAFQILFAGGDPEKFRVGKRTIIYTAIAYGIIFMASAISSIITDFLSGSSTLPPSNPVR